MKKKEKNELKVVDKILLKKVLNSPSSSCTESLYLELGLIPIHVILKARRINYLHYLVNLKDEEMLAMFLKIQWKYPCKEDWTTQVQEDLEDFGMDNDLEKIKTTSKNSFKRLVKMKAKKYALDYLQDLKASHSKMNNLVYTELKLQDYLKSEIPVNDAKNLYQFRVRVANFSGNFKGRYQSLVCPFC